MQEFFAEGKIVPLNIFYEDFVQQYEQTIRRILEHIELGRQPVTIPPLLLVQTADDVSEEWVQRFRTERQHEWTNLGW